jgi:YD repeat-containing protein
MDIPVGTYSGVPDISIPLYEVKDKSISIPLTLSYHASGITVDQEASWVGLGWDFFSGGYISQSVVGDQSPYLDREVGVPPGFNTFEGRFVAGAGYSGIAEYNKFVAWGCQGNGSLYEQQESQIVQYLKQGWGQPDIFSFSFLNHNGKFIIDRATNKPIVLDKKDTLLISAIGFNPYSSWNVRTTDGLQYFFEKKGSGVNNGKVVSYTWKLTKIKSLDGAVVLFEYSDQYAESFSFHESLASDFFEDDQPHKPLSYATAKNYDFYLKKITTSSEIVEFILDNRVDLKGSTLPDGTNSVKRLKEIVVKDRVSGKIKKSFEFQSGQNDGGYFMANETGNEFFPITASNRDYLCKRLKLNSVREVGYDVTGSKQFAPPYEFTYNEAIKLPPKISYAQDYWGYYNGRLSNAYMLPDLVPLYVASNEINTIPPTLLSTSYKANRGPSATHMTAAIIQKVKFPMGGSKTFYFEPHTFSNFTFYNADQVSEGTTKGIAVYDQNNQSASVLTGEIGPLSATTNVTFKVGFGRGHPSQGLTYDSLRDSYVQLKKQLPDGSFQVLRTWRIPIEFRQQIDELGYYNVTEIISLEPLPGVKYFVSAYLPDFLGPQNSSTENGAAGVGVEYYCPPASVGPIRSYGSGLRIARIDLSDEMDNVVVRRTYVYEQNGRTTGKLLSIPKFLKNLPQRSVKITPTYDGSCGLVVMNVKDIWTVSSQSNVSLMLSPNSGFVGYSAVKVIESNKTIDNLNNGWIVYEFINNENISGMELPEDANLDNGLPLRTTIFSKDNVKIKSTSYGYSPAPATIKKIYGYLLDDTFVGGVEGCTFGNGCGGGAWTIFSRYRIKRYPIRTGFYKLDMQIDSTFSNGNSITTTVAYEYNNFLKVRRQSATSSNGDVSIQESKYGHDYSLPLNPFPDSVVQNMSSKFFYPVIEESQLINQYIQKNTRHAFTYVSPGKYLLKSSTVRNLQGSILDFVQHTAHSPSTGNVRAYFSKSGINTVVLWGRNGTLPIAKIEGTSWPVVAAKVSPSSLETMTNVSSLRTELLKLYTISNCFVQLFFYDDKGQLIETIDAAKQSKYFEYDAMGRLSIARDHNQNILANYQYRYRSQP